MVPAVKRKRGDARTSHEGPESPNRPSPHRPGELGLAQQSSPQDRSPARGNHNQHGARGGRRNPRGGRSTGHGTVTNQPGLTPHSTSIATSKDAPTSGVAAHQEVESKSLQGQPPGTIEQTHTPKPIQNAPAKKTPDKKKSVPPKLPCLYTYITDDRLASWADTGRNFVIESAVKASEERNLMNLMNIFQEIIRSTLDFRMDASEAGKTIKTILDSPPINGSSEGVEAFLDMLSVLTDFGDINQSLKPFVVATEISPAKLRETLDEYLLKELGLVRSNFSTNFVRKQTRLLYRQSNYNLLREESEGFSKLMTELYTVANSETLSAEVVETTLENIKALIGAFDLDAGRVLDVILDAFASLLVRNTRFFVKFLRQSSYWPSFDDFENLLTESPPFNSLPVWAEPWHHQPTSTPEEDQEFSRSKDERDRLFWDRARAVGIDAFFELGGRRILDGEEKSKLTLIAHDPNDERAKETMRWIDLTNTLPPRGNPVAAQLLGFKLRFYASAARDEQDSLPPNLLHLAALLIKIGFISLRDLYSHLFPDDEGLDSIKEKKLKEKEEREQAKRPGGGAANALTRAGALSDDTFPVPTKAREVESRAATPSSKTDGAAKSGTQSATSGETNAATDTSEPTDQKVQLLESLLLVGAIPEALYILGRFPWLPDAFPDLPQYIHRLLHHSLSKVYFDFFPVGGRANISDPDRQADLAKSSKGNLQYPVEPLMPKILRRPKLEQDITEEGIGYRFYWEDWADNVPVCHTVDDVFTLCSTLLNSSGVKIGEDATLVSKISRIGKRSLLEDQSDRNRHRWLDLCKRLLCPALSQGEPNVGVANDVFDVLKMYPMKTRYSVYSEWFHGPASRLPDVSNAFNLAKLQTKAKLKRINNENTAEVASAIAKLTSSSPGVVFDAMLTQIESYGNLVDVLVDCPESFPPLAHDVFVWTLLSFLGKDGRSRLTSTGFSTSLWLQALSLFIGKCCAQYSAVNILPILQYVLQQLQLGNYTDLRVLRELVHNMAGIIPDTDFTDAQVEAMGGMQMLQILTLEQVGDTRYENKDSAWRLVKCLVENDLAGPFLVGITQLYQMCPFDPNKDSTKVLSETSDEISNIMNQYLSLLHCKLDSAEFDRVIPNIPTLISKYGIEPHLAFAICRKVLAQAILDFNGDSKKERKLSRSTGSKPAIQNGDTEMPDVKDNSGPQDTAMPDASEDKGSEEPTTGLTSNIGADLRTTEKPSGDVVDAKKPESSPWHPVLEEVMDSIRPLFPDDFESNMSLAFYVTFWQLSIQDISPASTYYSSSTLKLRNEIDAINKDRSDVSVAAVQEREAKKKFANEQQAKLIEEATASMQAQMKVLNRLNKEKDHWFKGFLDKWRSLNTYLLQECFLRRCVLSPIDSFITQKMFWWLHRNGTPGFRTMHVLDQIFSRKMLTNLIYQCTGREAGNLGRFLRDILKVLSSWHSSRTQYEKGALGKDKEKGTHKNLPGFVQKLAEDGSVEKFLDYEDFRRLLQKWHKNLFDTIRDCVKNFEYMHVKNACTVMRSIYIYFPTIEWMGNQLLDAANAVEMAERPPKKGEGPKPLAREDVHVAVSSLLGCLKKRKNAWITPQAFYLVNNPQRSQKGVPQTSASPLPRADPESTSKNLNAAAPEFEPASKQPEGSNDKPPISNTEVEDGEVKDTAWSNGTVDAKEADHTPPKEVKQKEMDSEKPGMELAKEKSSTSKPKSVHASRTSSPAPTQMKSEHKDANQLKERKGEPSTTSTLRDGRGTPNDSKKTRGSRHQSPHNPQDRLDDQRQPTSSGPPHVNGQKATRSGPRRDEEIQRPNAEQSNLQVPNQGQLTGDDDSRVASGESSKRQAPRSSHEASQRQNQVNEAASTPTDFQSAPTNAAQRPSQLSNDVGQSKSSASSINPERAALIEQSNKPGRDTRPSQQGERRPGPDNMRPPPPMQRPSRQSDPYHRREEPSRDDFGRGRPLAPYTDQAPGGPRSTRPREAPYSAEDHRANDFRQLPPFSRGGERPQSYSRDPSYGRLNPEANSPRASQPPYQERSERTTRPTNSSQDRRRDSGGPPPRSGPVPPYGASGERDVSSTAPPSQRHGPGRDQSHAPGTSASASQTMASGETTLHPSRVNQIEGRSEPPHPQPSTNNAPSGPRSTQTRGSEISRTGTLPSPPPREALSGPQTGSSERTDGRRQFAAARETLQQRGQTQRGPSSGGPAPSQRRDGPMDERGTSIRGRAGAGNSVEDSRAADVGASSTATSQLDPMGQPYERRGDVSMSSAARWRGEEPRGEFDGADRRPRRDAHYRTRDYDLPPPRSSGVEPGDSRQLRARTSGRELIDHDRGMEREREREREYSDRPPRLSGERGSLRRGEDVMHEDPYGYRERERDRAPRDRREEYRAGREAPYGPAYEGRQRPRRGPPPAEAGGAGSWNGGGRLEGRRNEAGERRELMGGANPRRDSRKRDWPGDGVPGPEESKRPRRGGR